jgi:hypothetical protein
MKSDIRGGFIAARRARDMNGYLVGANDVKSCRLRINHQHRPGLQRIADSLAAGDLCLGKSGDTVG